MKVLQINNLYKSGSTGKITYDIHQELMKRGIESIVCYGRGMKTTEKNIYKTCSEWYSKLNNAWSRVTGVMYGGLRFSTNKLISIIKKEKPDVVHLQCINGYFVNIYRLITWLKKSGIKTVLTLHAEFMHTANCGYSLECDKWKTGCGKCPRLKQETKSLFFDETHRSWIKMRKAFEGFDNLIVASVSPWLMERAKQSPILADKEHCVVLNGLDTDIFKLYETESIRKKHGLTNEKVVFHATPKFNNDPDHIKGGYYVLKIAEKMKDQNVKFFVAGPHSEPLDVPESVILLGSITDQALLAQYYSMADVTLLASKKETFSMICAESLSCGTPIVGFKAGAPEQITLPEYGKFVEYGDIDALCCELMKVLTNDYDRNVLEEKAHKVYNKANMIEEYIKIYKV